MIDHRHEQDLGPHRDSHRVLSWARPFCLIISFLGVLVPLAFWTGLYQPDGISGFRPAWDDPWLTLFVSLMIVLLLFLPVAWMTVTRFMDLIGLTLAHQALILIGFFFIETTAASLGGIIRVRSKYAIRKSRKIKNLNINLKLRKNRIFLEIYE
jgi:hypothetical protein